MKLFIFLGLMSMGQYSMAQAGTCGGYSLVNSTTTALVAPVAPVMENCETKVIDSNGQEIIQMDQQCLARNQVKQQAYAFQSNCYQQALSAQQAAQQAAATAEQQRLAQQAQLQSAKAAAEAAQSKNKEGSQIYQIAAIGCGIYSGIKAGQFAASCAGTCSMPLLYESLAYAALAMLASKQASSHDSVAHNACTVASQVNADGGGCGPAPPAYNPQAFPSNLTGTGPGTIGSIFDANGKCIGSQAACASIVAGLPPGTSIKEGLKGLSSFASGGSSKAFKVDKDGNLITKDGKKFKPEDFQSEKALLAAGLSAAEAKAALSAAGSAGGTLDARAALAKENVKDGALFGDGGGAGGAGGKGNALTANGAAGLGKDIGGGKRDPASTEGLARDFNGDMIGVAGDDIFKMMNRRYKLKSSQDNFISP